MAAGDSARENPKGKSILWRIVVGFFYFFVTVLAFVGAAELILEWSAWNWQLGRRWQPSDLNDFLAFDSPAMLTAKMAWENFKYLLQYGAYFLAAQALFIAATQIETVAQLMKDFLEARGAIYQLTGILVSAEATGKRISEQADRLVAIGPIIKNTGDKVEEMVLRLGDLQRLQVSERSDEEAESPGSAHADTTDLAQASADRNWQRLREIWNANGARLDEAIERISDKRRRNRFARMDRRNYPAIINGLADEGFISEAARDKSIELHSIFLQYRPRSSRVPDSVIGNLEVLDRMLAQELQPQEPMPETAPKEAGVDRGEAATV